MAEPSTALPANWEVCWIASYPKSGNTWVRFLLYQYFHGKAENSRDVSGFIPDIHIPATMRAARPIDGRLFIKTHFICGLAHPAMQRTAAAIYVIRHPRDVILSWLSYLRLDLFPRDLTNTEAAALVRAFLTVGGAPRYRSWGFGTWEEHFSAWLDGAHFPVHLIRYEDLRARGEVELSRMLEFLHIVPDPARVAEAVRLSGFEQMRSLEVREKTAGRPDALFQGNAEMVKRGILFMNKGQSGRSLEPFAPGLDKDVDERFAEAIRRFGY